MPNPNHTYYKSGLLRLCVMSDKGNIFLCIDPRCPSEITQTPFNCMSDKAALVEAINNNVGNFESYTETEFNAARAHVQTLIVNQQSKTGADLQSEFDQFNDLVNNQSKTEDEALTTVYGGDYQPNI